MSRLIVLISDSQGRYNFLKNEQRRCLICGTDLAEGDGIQCPNCKEKIIIDGNDNKGLKSLKLETQ